MTTTNSASAANTSTPTGYAVSRALSGLMLAAIGVQFFLAGLGVFQRDRHNVGDGYFDPHMMLGTAIGVLSLIVVIAVLIAKPGRQLVGMSVVLFLLAGPIEPLLAKFGTEDSAWYGALHAFTGALILALTAVLFVRLSRPARQGAATR